MENRRTNGDRGRSTGCRVQVQGAGGMQCGIRNAECGMETIRHGAWRIGQSA